MPRNTSDFMDECLPGVRERGKQNGLDLGLKISFYTDDIILVCGDREVPFFTRHEIDDNIFKVESPRERLEKLLPGLKS